MTRALKYIVYRDSEGVEVIETFPTSTIHAAYAAFRDVERARILAAGFVSQERRCFGASSSLGIASRPSEDTALLAGSC